MTFPKTNIVSTTSAVLVALAWCGMPAHAQDAAPDVVSASTCAEIRAAYDASRHAAFAVEGGYCARNPGQQWMTRFDGRGFETKPDEGGWTWGLKLERFGFPGAQREMTTPKGMTSDGPRVAYAWNDIIEEWFINDARGLEHGFTLNERPATNHDSNAGALTLTLAVRGSLTPSVSEDGRSVAFTNSDGETVLNYAGLSVFDADRRSLSARFDRMDSRLLLSIDERGARYPLTIDPLAQQAYLKSSNTGAADEFGFGVSLSGDTLVVAAHAEDSAATGVNGNGASNSALNSGAAYVFVRNGTTWSPQAYLKASNTGAGDHFGGPLIGEGNTTVDIFGDTIVVGAPGEDSAATGVNGNEASNSAPDSGAAYVFVRNGTTWTQQAYLKASNTEAGDQFGFSVAISGDTIVVGAAFEDSAATSVNGNQSNNSAGNAGAAYVFVRTGTTWSQQAYIKTSNMGISDLFGWSASIDGDSIVVSARDEDSAATGVNGNQNNNSASDAGAAYVFVRSGSTWTQQAYLKASNTGVFRFGEFVSNSEDTVIVGSRLEGSAATGVNGNQNNNSAPSAGAVYVFVRNGTTWSQQAYLKASNTGAGDFFGMAGSIDRDLIVVGARDEDSAAIGVNGNQNDNSATDSGAAYVFLRIGATWSQQAYLKASNTGAGDLFLWPSISGHTVVVGAPGEDSTATGVDGNQASNLALGSGSAYVFDLNVWSDLGSGLAGVIGVPQLEGAGTLLPGTMGSLTLTHAAPSAPSILLVSVSSTPVPAFCGTVVPFPVSVALNITTPAIEGIHLIWPSWPAGLSGQSLYFQWLIADAAAPCSVAFSNALRADAP